ncbi:hypothetical protein [Alloalcanivorax mobilis]|uniref:hypothetical protein n=1 Tax=Alloalcanivorax mobilis TaxID=2019569 RepID=UPI000C78ED87|nr:hypothetical protein [Alloalcanivorax mobilis]
MTSNPLENLARTGQLKPEPPVETELSGLFLSGQRRLADAERESLSLESRFDLAYNAAHALALTALRLQVADQPYMLPQRTACFRIELSRIA